MECIIVLRRIETGKTIYVRYHYSYFKTMNLNVRRMFDDPVVRVRYVKSGWKALKKNG